MGLAGAVGGGAIGGAMLAVRGAQAMGAGKATGFIGSRLLGAATSVAKEVGNSKLGQSINSGINTIKNSSAAQAVGSRLNQAKNIGSKINNFTKGQGWKIKWN